MAPAKRVDRIGARGACAQRNVVQTVEERDDGGLGEEARGLARGDQVLGNELALHPGAQIGVLVAPRRQGEDDRKRVDHPRGVGRAIGEKARETEEVDRLSMPRIAEDEEPARAPFERRDDGRGIGAGRRVGGLALRDPRERLADEDDAVGRAPEDAFDPVLANPSEERRPCLLDGSKSVGARPRRGARARLGARPELARELVDGRETLPRILLHRAQNGALEGRRNRGVRCELAGAPHRLVEVLPEQLGRRRRAKRRHADEQLVSDDPHGVEITSRRGDAMLGLLGRHVGRRARGRLARIFVRFPPRRAEVEETEPWGGLERLEADAHAVRRRDVAMNAATRVNGAERGEDLEDDLASPGLGDGAVRRDDLRQGHAIVELGRKKRRAVRGVATRERPQNVGMIDAPERRVLAEQARRDSLVRGRARDL